MSVQESVAGEAEQAPTAAATTGGRRWLVLVLLLLVYILNYMDRSIVSILGQPIKEELRLADWQLGLLNGLAFSAIYVILGFPLARLADRKSRVAIVSACVLVWSAMTALCGLAASFAQLLLYRMGVGVGEAGCMPSCHSLITDYFPPKLRATALSVYGLGLPLGGLMGLVVGGVVVDRWGWRRAFMLVGAPGVILALIVLLFVREPPRGQLEATPARPDEAAGAKATPFWAILKLLWSTPSSRHILIAVTLAVTMGSPSSAFLAPYMVRKFGLSYTALGLILGLTLMLGAAVATLGSGLLTDWAGKRDRRWYVWAPALGMAASGPLYVIGYAQSSWQALAAMFCIASIVGATYVAPCYAVLHNIVQPRMRATTTAIVQFCMNMIGMGLGPLACGFMIDWLSGRLFAGRGLGDFTVVCPGGAARPGAPEALASACHAALTGGTQYTLMAWSAVIVWPALHLFLASRTVRNDAKF